MRICCRLRQGAPLSLLWAQATEGEQSLAIDKLVVKSWRLRMEGLVSWTGEGLVSGYGEVITCRQEDTMLNIVFTCHGSGEGQITLSITTVEQFASARFIYTGMRERTYAGVVGRLSWQPGSLQFEGKWDDQGYDTVWSFSIEVEGFNFAAGTVDGGEAPDPAMESVDEVLSTLDRRYLTDWFEPEVTPLRPGVYRVDSQFSACGSLAYAAWDGASWSGARRRSDELENLASHEQHGGRAWLGLTEEGALRVSLLLDGVRRREIERMNSTLQASLRQEEIELGRVRAAAHAVYLQLLAQIDRSGHTSATRKTLRDILGQLVSTDLDSPAEAAFDMEVAGTAEAEHVRLLAAREGIAVRAGYWRTYWLTVQAKHPAFAHELTSNGLVVGYGKDMQARLGKNASMQPLPGSFGTKPRQ